MKYYTYVIQNGNTVFYEQEQKKLTKFVGIFELEESETHYKIYNGVSLIDSSLLYKKYVNETLELLRQEVKSIAIDDYNKSIAKLKEGYPVEEVSGWDTKLNQSILWNNSLDKEELLESNKINILKNESDGTIEGIDILSSRVIINANIYETIYGKNTKKMKELLVEINSASTINELVQLKGQIIYD
jgi:hypothetical protein